MNLSQTTNRIGAILQIMRQGKTIPAGVLPAEILSAIRLLRQTDSIDRASRLSEQKIANKP
jgi:hypothetical protein